jgi:hypothetical protein
MVNERIGAVFIEQPQGGPSDFSRGIHLEASTVLPPTGQIVDTVSRDSETLFPDASSWNIRTATGLLRSSARAIRGMDRRYHGRANLDASSNPSQD